MPCKGMSNKMIADACKISIDTVKAHVKNIYDKLQVLSENRSCDECDKK